MNKVLSEFIKDKVYIIVNKKTNKLWRYKSIQDDLKQQVQWAQSAGKQHYRLGTVEPSGTYELIADLKRGLFIEGHFPYSIINCFKNIDTALIHFKKRSNMLYELKTINFSDIENYI